MSVFNWKGLLKWSLEYSDGTHPTDPMDEERLEFLRAAIKSIEEHGMTTDQIVKSVVADLTDSTKTQTDNDYLDCLTVIEECIVIDPEISRNLHLFETLPLFLRLLNHANTEISEAVLRILSFSFQNNEKLQQEAFKHKFLDALLDLVDVTQFSPARIGAISGLIRNYREATEEFLYKRNGLNWMLTYLNSENPKIMLKIINMIIYLTSLEWISSEIFISSNLLNQMLIVLDKRSKELSIQIGESFLQAISMVVDRCENKLTYTYDNAGVNLGDYIVKVLTKHKKFLLPQINDRREEFAICLRTLMKCNKAVEKNKK